MSCVCSGKKGAGKKSGYDRYDERGVKILSATAGAEFVPVQVIFNARIAEHMALLCSDGCHGWSPWKSLTNIDGRVLHPTGKVRRSFALLFMLPQDILHQVHT